MAELTTGDLGGVVQVEYTAGGRRHIGTLVPAVSASRALAVLLPDWRGAGALALEHAAQLARLGCLTLVADLYGDGFRPADVAEVGPRVQYLLDHRSEGVAALSAAVAALRQAAGAPAHPVVVVAFSAGAVVALDHARLTQEAAAVVACSGLLRTAEPGTPTRIGAPVVLVQGSQDEVSPLAVLTEVLDEADAAGNDLRLVLMSQTHHAFDNPDAGTDTTARLVYSARSARRAWQVIAGVLEEVLTA